MEMLGKQLTKVRIEREEENGGCWLFSLPASGSLPGPMFTVEVAGEKLGRAPISSRRLQKHFSFLPRVAPQPSFCHRNSNA